MKLNDITNLCRTDKKIAIHVGVVALFAFVAIGGGVQLQKSYAKAEENKKQIENMTTVIDKYNKLATQVNAEDFRPVDDKQLDFIQTDILTKVQDNKLVLKQFDNKKDKKATNYKNYTLTVQGDWSNIVNFLQNFNSRDALIGISNINMSHSKDGATSNNQDQIINNQVECEIAYKVYTK